MCGIFASISTQGVTLPNAQVKQLLQRRGPDHVKELSRTLSTDKGDLSLHFLSTVLALRGGHVTPQPFDDPETGSLLCWNGEAWDIDGAAVDGNDGDTIFRLLTSFAAQQVPINAVLDVLRSISGPFAFVFFDECQKLLYFGRDRLGRRSLLLHVDNATGTFQVSSTAGSMEEGWVEVEADGIYVMSLSQSLEHPYLLACTENTNILNGNLYRCPWDTTFSDLPTTFRASLNKERSDAPILISEGSSPVAELMHLLHESLKPRVLNIPIPPLSALEDAKLAVLFSGGLDCTVLARMAHDILPLNHPIDLLNVAFENPRVVRAAAPKADAKGPDEASNGDSAYESCPDRITGRASVEELRRVCPGRAWRFVAINVPYAEFLSHRSAVARLIHPHNTEMDLSIASALYFASRGQGVASTAADVPPMEYTTAARVLLSGLGADELFGGYTRHATAFSRRGLPGLVDELELDYRRLGKRNLGRDDRVIANWSKEARFPFLDEGLVDWALKAPVMAKCGFGMSGQGPHSELEPGKLVLRLLASRLGMTSVAREKKRAIQFGARTAKMETGRTKGTTLIS